MRIGVSGSALVKSLVKLPVKQFTFVSPFFSTEELGTCLLHMRIEIDVLVVCVLRLLFIYLFFLILDANSTLKM